MSWGLVGLVLLVCALWVGARRAAGRDVAMRVSERPDPFVSRRAMRRYHAALRPKRQ